MTKITPSTVLVCAVTRPQGAWRWQRRGALSVYQWTGKGCGWRFVRYANRSMRYDRACAEADFIGRPTAAQIVCEAA
jgi:hypothetical protein